MQLLYFGRLEHEKGITAIIDMIQYFGQTKGTIPFVLHIFGQGSYQSQIQDLAKQYPQNILYYGFKPLQEIQQTTQYCDYCLMPSLFLETFGLIALNACSRGLPVIGYAKAGCRDFILPDYDLNQYEGDSSKQLIQCISQLLQKNSILSSNKHKVIKISEQYNTKTRLEHIHTLTQNKKKILLVSDFIQKLGGIETYIHDSKELLESASYEVELIGSDMGKTKSSKILSMIVSLYNIPFALRLQKKITQFQPDIIRYHSVLRHIGRFPLRYTSKSNAQKRIMYHDLGYFHPFPSQVYDEKQIPKNLSRHEFTKGYNRIKKVLITGKWILLRLLHKQIKTINTHLTPSDFMHPYVQTVYNTPQVTTLPHFIQK